MKGVLLFAYNNERVNYVKLATICGGMANKAWDLPVCVVSDEPKPAQLPKGFIRWIHVDRPQRLNTKSYPDYGTALSFWNANRHNAFDITPFDQTILMDTDLLVQTTNIPDAWDGRGVKLSKKAHSVDGTEFPNDTKMLSYRSMLDMYWATVVCFDKSSVSEEFFRMWKCAVEMYSVYAPMYGFEPGPMRNDFAVTVALERLKGNTQSGFFDLPYSIPTLLPGSTLLSLDPMIAFVAGQHPEELDMLPVFSDLHVMNKKSILE